VTGVQTCALPILDEIEDPELGIERLMETYLRKGYSKEWINQRLCTKYACRSYNNRDF
jgi:hypothetical protein